MSKTTTPPPEDPSEIRLTDALEERYLAYALSTIMHRALPDVRDGLKPVHRRLLYAMQQLKLDPNSGFKKSARVVGDVIGRYHPHGDQAVYDALVRLAQDFAVRYPLIEGQGNFGNVDGDNAAAMRYTESRLTRVAMLLLDGLDEDTVDFRQTYDGEDEEPVVLPGAFPNLLANGSSGIAVGMATSIPPHNVAELCEATLHLIKHPNASTEKLVDFVKGPDLPTGGILIDTPAQIAEAYATGRGAFRVRARWEREDLGRGQWQIVVTEIPYQVQKSKLVERIAELLTARKLPLLGDVRDESAEEIRLVLEPKSRTVDPEHLMESLFRSSELESRLSLNMNVLEMGTVPRVMGLREVLRAWADHRLEVLLRRTRFRLDKIAKRLEVLEGYLVAYLNLDEVIRIIREEDEPKQEMMKTFDITDNQAEAILNMRLRALRKLEEFEIRKEHDQLSEEQADLQNLLASEEAQWGRVSDEIKALKTEFGPKTALGRRRSTFEAAPAVEEVPLEAMLEREPITVICSEKGWIRALKGHQPSDADVKFKEGDGPRFQFHAHTTDKLILFASDGRFFTLGADKLPGGRGHGEPVRLMVDLAETHEIVALFVHRPGRKLLIASSDGNGFIVPEDDVLASKRSGKQVMSLGGAAEAVVCRPAEGDHLAVLGENRKLLVFPLSEVNELSRGKGVRLQRYTQGGLADAKSFELATGLIVYDRSGRARTYAELDEWIGNRAGAGKAVPRGFPTGRTFGGGFGE